MNIYRFFWPILHSPACADELNRYSRTRFFRSIGVLAAGLVVCVCLLLTVLQLSPSINAVGMRATTANTLKIAGAMVLGGLAVLVAFEAFISNNYLHLLAFITLSVIEVTTCVRASNALYQLRKSGLHLTDEGYSQVSEITARLRYTDIVQNLAFILVLLSALAWAAKAFSGASADWNLTAITVVVVAGIWLAEPSIVLTLLKPEIRELLKDAKLHMVGNYTTRKLRLHDAEGKYPVPFRNESCDGCPRFLGKLIADERIALADSTDNKGARNG